MTGDRRTGWRWATGAAGEVLHSTTLADVAPHLFSTRALTSLATGDGDVDVYGPVGTALGVPGDAVVRVAQVHGRVVVSIGPGEACDAGTQADAVVSTDPARVVSVRVADCVPLLIADRGRRVVAAVHAGWKGTCAGIAEATIHAITALGVPASELVVAIGPSIGPCCYQVDSRVRNAFLAMTPDAASWMEEDGEARWKLDLWQANVDQLERCGVPAESIAVSRVCTAESLDRCYSYRAEGPGTGRLIAAIGMAGRAD